MVSARYFRDLRFLEVFVYNFLFAMFVLRHFFIAAYQKQAWADIIIAQQPPGGGVPPQSLLSRSQVVYSSLALVLTLCLWDLMHAPTVCGSFQPLAYSSHWVWVDHVSCVPGNSWFLGKSFGDSFMWAYSFYVLLTEVYIEQNLKDSRNASVTDMISMLRVFLRKNRNFVSGVFAVQIFQMVVRTLVLQNKDLVFEYLYPSAQNTTSGPNDDGDVAGGDNSTETGTVDASDAYVMLSAYIPTVSLSLLWIGVFCCSWLYGVYKGRNILFRPECDVSTFFVFKNQERNPLETADTSAAKKKKRVRALRLFVAAIVGLQFFWCFCWFVHFEKIDSLDRLVASSSAQDAYSSLESKTALGQVLAQKSYEIYVWESVRYFCALLLMIASAKSRLHVTERNIFATTIAVFARRAQATPRINGGTNKESSDSLNAAAKEQEANPVFSIAAEDAEKQEEEEFDGGDADLSD